MCTSGVLQTVVQCSHHEDVKKNPAPPPGGRRASRTRVVSVSPSVKLKQAAAKDSSPDVMASALMLLLLAAVALCVWPGSPSDVGHCGTEGGGKWGGAGVSMAPKLMPQP